MHVLANLKQEQLRVIQEFEQKAGVRVLALAPMEIDPASIDADLLTRLQEMEKELGVCLVAVR